jgi:nucleoside phosphorylase
MPTLSEDDLSRYRRAIGRAVRTWGQLADHVRARLAAALRRVHGTNLRDGFEGSPDIPRTFAESCITFREALIDLYGFEDNPPVFPWPQWGRWKLTLDGPLPDLDQWIASMEGVGEGEWKSHIIDPFRQHLGVVSLHFQYFIQRFNLAKEFVIASAPNQPATRLRIEKAIRQVITGEHEREEADRQNRRQRLHQLFTAALNGMGTLNESVDAWAERVSARLVSIGQEVVAQGWEDWARKHAEGEPVIAGLVELMLRSDEASINAVVRELRDSPYELRHLTDSLRSLQHDWSFVFDHGWLWWKLTGDLPLSQPEPFPPVVSPIPPDSPPLSFHSLAFELLGIEGLPLPRTNWHLKEGQDGFDDPYLDDQQYQKLGNIVCERVPGMTVQSWRESTPGQRIALMQTAIQRGTQQQDSRLHIDDIDGFADVPAAVATAPPRPDLVLVTVNEHETRAVHDAFLKATGTEGVPVPLEGQLYHNLGSINGTTVYHAISEKGSSGPGAMQQAVDKAIRALHPGAVIAVGIAFGVSEKDESLGDILLSTQIQLYELQRAGSEIVLRGDKPHAAPRLINHFEVFNQVKWAGAKVRPGLLLSGEKLIDDKDYRDQLVALQVETVGGEMEGAGLYVASADHKVDWIVIKAICDWADGNKKVNKTQRQKKAANNAADFLVESLKYAPLKRLELRVPSRD